jgi:hypothetical protein
MPEESPGADEHAIIQEITAPLSSFPDDPLSSVADVSFPIVLRGYDRLAVDAYVKRTSQLVAELQSTRSPEAAVRRALERVGEEVSGILQRAHEAAAQITAQSHSDAEDRLERARQEETQLTAGAKDRLKELDAETDRIWAERQRIVEDAQELARQLLSLAEAAAERFPAAEEAQPEEHGEAPVAAEPVPEPYRPVAANGEGGHEDEPAESPAYEGDENETHPFDGDATAIMPPIEPDERQDS